MDLVIICAGGSLSSDLENFRFRPTAAGRITPKQSFEELAQSASRRTLRSMHNELSLY